MLGESSTAQYVHLRTKTIWEQWRPRWQPRLPSVQGEAVLHVGRHSARCLVGEWRRMLRNSCAKATSESHMAVTVLHHRHLPLQAVWKVRCGHTLERWQWRRDPWMQRALRRNGCSLPTCPLRSG